MQAGKPWVRASAEPTHPACRRSTYRMPGTWKGSWMRSSAWVPRCTLQTIPDVLNADLQSSSIALRIAPQTWSTPTQQPPVLSMSQPLGRLPAPPLPARSSCSTSRLITSSPAYPASPPTRRMPRRGLRISTVRPSSTGNMRYSLSRNNQVGLSLYACQCCTDQPTRRKRALSTCCLTPSTRRSSPAPE